MSSEDHVSIEGAILMLDNATPHVAAPVQLIQGGKVITTVLSDERGLYRFIDLEPGTYQVRCYTLNGYVYYGEEKAGEPESREARSFKDGIVPDESIGLLAHKPISLRVKRGKTLKDIDFRFPPFKKGTWKNYTYLDGLADNFVFAVHSGADGRMWFGTEGGISRYDGKEFVNFTTEDGLRSNKVFAIHCDPDGVMWFGTNGGISRYTPPHSPFAKWGSKGGFVNLTTENGLVHDSVRCIHRDPDGAMWIGTVNGISRYDGKQFINFTTEDGLVNDYVKCAYCNPDGALWFGTEGGISRYDGKEFVNFTTDDGLAGNVVWSICRDPYGMMWFGTEGGVSRYDGKKLVSFTTEDGLANNEVRCIHCDPDGTLRFGTFGGGVSRYDGKGFVNFAAADGLSNHVLAIHRDEDGPMWFGTVAEGVFRYDEKELLTFTTRDGLASNDVTAIQQTPDGALWVGTYGGVSVYHSKGFVNLTTEDGLVHDWVLSIHCDPDGVMWFGTEGGVSRYDGKEFTSFTTEDGLANNDVQAVDRDPGGALWFGTHEAGVSRYITPPLPLAKNGSKGEIINLTTEDGLASNWVSVIHCDPDGVMWFGTSAGVSRYIPPHSPLAKGGNKGGFVNFNTEDGLVHNDVAAVHHAPDGALWFGTEGGGVSRYDRKTFVNFTIQNGLANNKVMAVYAAPDGITWFGTFGGGVGAYDGIAWTSLDTRDGLANNIVQSICPEANGSLWFATEGGLTRYRRSSKSPQVHIVSITTDQTYRDLDAIPAITVGTRVTIEYNSIDLLTIPEKRQYRCRVQVSGKSLSKKEVDSDWQKPTRSTFFDHTFEEEGTYIFEVQAINRDLNYSEPARMFLTIEPDPTLVSMQTELSYLRSEVGQKYQFQSIIGSSHAIMQVRGLMEKAIESRLAVLITGETGTGKELVAKAIHHNSRRADHPLLALNCGARTKELLTSELFGHRRGAFTGAREDKMGLFEAASGGTIILDEISEMPEDAQVYLLRVLEERVVQRLGEHISRDVDVRVIAITNRDLMKEVSEGRFREDLYYRLSVFPIYIPPLRERVEDIPPLAEHFLQDVERELDGFAPEVFGMLQSYSWPGNVRELRNAVHRAAALAEREIQTYHFPPEITGGESLIQDAVAAGSGYSEAVKSFQRRLVEQTLKECDGNRHEAARLLKMDRANLLRLMKRLGIS